MEAYGGSFAVGNQGNSAVMSAGAEGGKKGTEGAAAPGAGSMQYQGSGMAPHAPLHPSGPEGSVEGDSCGCGDESAEKMVSSQPEMGGEMNSREGYGQPQMGGSMSSQGVYGQPQMGGSMSVQGVYGQPQMGGSMSAQGVYGQPQMGGSMSAQGVYGQPQMGGSMSAQGVYGQPLMGGSMSAQGVYGQPQMGGSMSAQGVYGQPLMGSGMPAQGVYGQPQMSGSMNPQNIQGGYSQQNEPAGDMNRFGQYLGVINDVASGRTPELPEIAQMVQQAPGDFWKGAIVGAAVGLLLTSESVRSGLGSVLGAVFSGFGGEDEVEEE